MLGEDELLALARARRIRPYQEELRYLQALILYSLSDSPLVAKGGTYLWMFHGLNRFSQDLDYTSIGGLPQNLPRKVEETLMLFGVEGKGEVLKSDEFTFTFRLKLRGPLYHGEKDLRFVRVEVSLREKVKSIIPVRLEEFHYGIPLTYLRGMGLEEVLTEKIRAFLVRGEVKDLYDLWFLIKKGIKLDSGLLKEKLSFYGMKLELNDFLEKVEGMRYAWRGLEPMVFGLLPPFDEVLSVLRDLRA